MTFLLEIAAGDVEALREAAALTDQPQRILREAAGFFIEQILFGHNTDNYRILGANRESSHTELRQHMALLMRWLHPDIVSGGASRPCLDRSIYVNRVIKAWEAVKTDEQRAAYNGSLRLGVSGQGRVGSLHSARQKPNGPPAGYEFGAPKKFNFSQSRRRSLWSRIVVILGGRG
jgi:hypothetical protein